MFSSYLFSTLHNLKAIINIHIIYYVKTLVLSWIYFLLRASKASHLSRKVSECRAEYLWLFYPENVERIWKYKHGSWNIPSSYKIYHEHVNKNAVVYSVSRSQWSRGLRRGSAVVGFLGLRVRIPREAWITVCCEYCVLSGRGFCDRPISCPEESYRMWCVTVCGLETSGMRRPWPTLGCYARKKKRNKDILCIS